MTSQMIRPVVIVALMAMAGVLDRPASALPADSEQVESSVAPETAAQRKSSQKKARADMQKLIDDGVKALSAELVEKGSFYPFAAVLGNDNEVRLVGVPAAQRNTDPETALSALVARIHQLALERRIRAAAYFMDYVAQRKDTGFTQPGIRVELNHRHPDAMSVFIPYSITPDKKLRLMTPEYRPGKNLTFESK